jgi:outer membrane protein OmpA-like peptidoglycan-associated protein
MANEGVNQKSQVYSQSVRRTYWRRRDPRAGWGWSGWLPLAGLVGVFAYGIFQTAPAIEAQTAAEVRSALEVEGLEQFDVEADGQDVLIRARGSDAQAAGISALARVTACDTWIAGPRTCPRDVRVQMSGEAQVEDPVSETLPRFHNFNFRESGGVLTLDGEVPDEATRQAIVSAARESFSTVIDNLRVTGELPTDGFDWAVDRAWPALTVIRDAEVGWLNGRLSVSGEVTGNDVADVRRSLSTAAFSDRLGAVNLREAATAEPAPEALVDVCTQQFSAALSRSSIQFRTGSAEIAPTSEALLDELAQIARGCPMALSIEGHTDSTGPAQFNRMLSLGRAQAVVTALQAAGIDAARLSAEGFGADRPVADNATATGRALNRRIEIKVTQEGGGE